MRYNSSARCVVMLLYIVADRRSPRPKPGPTWRRRMQRNATYQRMSSYNYNWTAKCAIMLYNDMSLRVLCYALIIDLAI